MDGNSAQNRRTTYLSDYRPSDFVISEIDLRFDLYDEVCNVRAQMQFTRSNTSAPTSPLRLDGDELDLVSVQLQGSPLGPDQYQVTSSELVIPNVPDVFSLSVDTRIFPSRNTTLMGLYLSGGTFCTQCEAEGFRRMTFMLDRPDVLARYSTTIVAERERFPVLLSNGNCTDQGDAGAGRHYATWKDPFPKPSYLFALVAGKLAFVEDHFVTFKGRKVALRIFVEPHNIDKCSHAMASLKRAMRWDEEVYGREYDLDIYMIVAVDDFNMGAMENKGLNLFNSKYVLARPETATDADYQVIEAIIAHEYFHNWSGNRVTCRDWFQLSLKEGFTVFRDQEFTSDMHSRAVKRIQDVNILRNQQFREDGGPMAHPVRPSSYIEINNFYTVTIYNKGAELIRMMYHLLGARDFRAGTDLYFERHDGQAVTIDDFVVALEDAGGINLGQFKRWYVQSGTPELHITGQYDSQRRLFTVQVRQSCPPTPGQDNKLPFHFPLVMALLDRSGKRIPLRLQGETPSSELADKPTRVLSLHEAHQSFTFVNVDARPTPSYLRGFSAPVKWTSDLTEQDLIFLAMHDDDPFSRWDANQRVQISVILDIVYQRRADAPANISKTVFAIAREHLNKSAGDPLFASMLLSLPSEQYIAEFMSVIDPVAIHQACRRIREALVEHLYEEFIQTYTVNEELGEYRIDIDSIAKRSLKNTCLGYLMESADEDVRSRCVDQCFSANNMTDSIAALTYLANSPGEDGKRALDGFYQRWQHDPLVIDKWFTIQAASRLPDTLERMRVLLQHPSFTLRNPNRIRAVIGTFAHGNPMYFHHESGEGYELVADYIVALDEINPQITARLASAFALWRRFDAARQLMMQEQLKRIAAKPHLSRDTYEVVTTVLGASQ